MDIQTIIDPATQLITFTVKGELDFNQLLDHINSIHARSEHTSRCLWDLRSVTGGERVTVLQIGRFYELCGKYFYREPIHKIAFVVGKQIGFGLAQVMRTFEELNDVYLNVRVFRNFHKTMQWLFQDPVSNI